MEAFRSVIVEASRHQFTVTELLSYKEVLHDAATEEWYAQREPDEVYRKERNCMRLAYILFQSPTRSVAAHLESYLLL